MKCIVNREDGFRLQPNSKPVPCGETVDVPPDVAEDQIAKGYLIGAEPGKMVEPEDFPDAPAGEHPLIEIAPDVIGVDDPPKTKKK